MAFLDRFDRVVRCGAGHYFTTIWVPLVSLKAVRLGRRRFQYCPVGRHWTRVERIDDPDVLTRVSEEAAQHHDIRVP